MTLDPHTPAALEHLLNAGIFALLRVGGVVAFAPPFQSAAVPPRIKAMLSISVAVLLAPVAAALPGTAAELTVTGLLGEAVVGVLIGLTLSLLNEALLFAGNLMSVSFSFSLANLLDPNSAVETEVLGVLLNWIGVLVLLASGLHRAIFAALFRSLAAVPLGTATVHALAGRQFAFAMAGVFLAGVQLASPVMASALLVEIGLGLVGRVAPGLPTQILSVPLKTAVSYVAFIGSLALWPGWIERHFSALLDAAMQAVRP